MADTRDALHAFHGPDRIRLWIARRCAWVSECDELVYNVSA